MSWLLLGLAVLWGVPLLVAFFPVQRRFLLGFTFFLASSMTIELAWVHLLVATVVVTVLVWAGALDHWAGWLGLALAVLEGIAYVVMIVRSRATAGLVDVAFAELTDDVPASERGGIRRTRNVVFARVAGRELKLDVVAPADPAPDGVRRPALLQLHGGVWVAGDKREQGQPLVKAMAKLGWVCVNANYRLSPAATWPDHLVDVKRAIAWIREHADELGVDPSFVAVTGGSAGGHLASMAALTQNDPRYQPGFEDADTSVQACVPFYGVYDLTNRDGTMPRQLLDRILQPLIIKAFLADEPERFAAASPLDQVRADAPPFLVVHGDHDTLAPVADARRFVHDLAEVSTSPVLYLELHGAQHSFDVLSSPRTRRVVRAVHRFLATMWVRHRAGQAPSEPEPGEPGLPGPTEGTELVGETLPDRS
jgi:acetyl esterase/lipase